MQLYSTITEARGRKILANKFLWINEKNKPVLKAHAIQSTSACGSRTL
jgi:hypothetical protein